MDHVRLRPPPKAPRHRSRWPRAWPRGRCTRAETVACRFSIRHQRLPALPNAPPARRRRGSSPNPLQRLLEHSRSALHSARPQQKSGLAPTCPFDPLQSEMEVYSPGKAKARYGRSEEHTSELQSRLHLVCRLLLEKKKRAIQTSSSVTLIFLRYYASESATSRVPLGLVYRTSRLSAQMTTPPIPSTSTIATRSSRR